MDINPLTSQGELSVHTPPRSRQSLTARLAVGVGVGALAAVGLVTPSFAAPTTHVAPAESIDPPACEVSAATLSWGVKESFRSYISGAIANGEWTVSDDMRYETPSFIWDQVSGSVTPELDAGEIAFTGAVHFTGHDGAMTLDLANPKIEFAADNSAYLLLDIGSADTTSGGESAEQTEVRAAKLDLATALNASGTELTIDGAVPRLTAEGATALNGAYGSYVAGEELDPITLDATVAGCELGEQIAEAPEEPEEVPLDPTTPVAAETQEPQIPWLPIGIGAVALLVIGITGGMLLGGKGKNANKNQSPTEDK